jgi:competence protein ComEC
MALAVHFLNVGEGDCTIIEHPSGRISVVDLSNIKSIDSESAKELLISEALARGATAEEINAALLQEAISKAAPLTDALEYYDANIGARKDIFRLIITHPHMDHISGIDRLINHEPKSVENFWHASRENFDLDDDSKWSKGMGRFNRDDWRTYKAVRDSAERRTFDQRRSATNSYWKEDQIEIWAPTDHLVATAVAKNDQNILSMVLKVSHAGRSILLGGDASAEESWPPLFESTVMSDIDVFKASHHGRNSGYHQLSVKEMSPWLTITSVGQKEHDATENYRQYSDYTVSTRFTGDIKITIEDDGTLVYPDVLEQHWRPKK